MSRARHKMRASGGGLSSKPEFEAGGGSNAAKEAEEKKRGGKVHHAEGGASKKRADKRARGGHVKKKDGGEVECRADGGSVGNYPAELHEVKNHSMKHTRGRARGGKIGADKAPLTTAAKVKTITPGETSVDGVEDMAKSAATIKG
jgi:hypothetical protein